LPAKSTSFNGTPVYLFLLRDGKVIEEMYGNYDSYGRVFTTELRKDVPHELYESFEWSCGWDEVCNLMFTERHDCGIALIRAECYNGQIPTTRSDDDPDQGWGSDGELMGDCSSDGFVRVTNPYHKVY
jgi:hypothetical protein